MTNLSAAERSNLDRLAQSLVRTKSPPGHEGEVASLLLAEMRSLGLADVHADRAGNVSGRVGSGSPPVLVFNGHMDHVGAGDVSQWRHDPFAGVVEEGVLFGRGACDMKGGLAALVHGAGLLARSGGPAKGTLYVLGVVQEETCEGLAMRHWIESSGVRPDFVLLGEPSDLRVALGHPGRLEIRLETRGRAAHGSAPDRGENAIYHMARLALGVEALNTRLPMDPVMGKGSISLDVISGGNDLNVVPDRCEALVDRRLSRGETELEAISGLQAAAAGAGVAASIQVLSYSMPSYNGFPLTARQYFPAWYTPPDHFLSQALARAAAEVTGCRPDTHVWRFSTDGAYSAGIAGIPTVGYGPGEERFAHTALDQVRLADVHAAALVYARLASDILR